MDVRGIRVCKGFYDQAKVTYPALVDPRDQLGRAMGFTVVPNEFYFDETGRYRGKINTVEGDAELRKMLALEPLGIASSQPASDPPLFADAPSGDDIIRLRAAVVQNPASVAARFRLAAALLEIGDREAALATLREAHVLKPDDWIIRKQIWALENPEKFYNGPIDVAWQREKLTREVAPPK